MPKQANTSTITSALIPPPLNNATKAPTVANPPRATQISTAVASTGKSNATRRVTNTSSPNAAIHNSHAVGSTGPIGVSSPPFVLLSSY